MSTKGKCREINQMWIKWSNCRRERAVIIMLLKLLMIRKRSNPISINLKLILIKVRQITIHQKVNNLRQSVINNRAYNNFCYYFSNRVHKKSWWVCERELSVPGRKRIKIFNLKRITPSQSSEKGWKLIASK